MTEDRRPRATALALTLATLCAAVGDGLPDGEDPEPLTAAAETTRPPTTTTATTPATATPTPSATSAGPQTATADGATATATATPATTGGAPDGPDAGSGDGAPGFGALVTLAALLSGGLVARRRR